jgi:hypothetical protein
MNSWLFSTKFPALVPGSSSSTPFLTTPVFRLERPCLPHRLAHQRTDPRRIATPSHAHQAYLSPKLRVDDRQTNDARVFDCVCRHECKSQPGGHHSQGPIVALAPIDGLAGDSPLLENLVGITGNIDTILSRPLAGTPSCSSSGHVRRSNANSSLSRARTSL